MVAQAEALVDLSRVTLGSDDAENQIVILQDHWWVEWSDGSVWTALDLAAGEMGTTLTTASETIQPTDFGALDEALRHTVTVRLVAECWQDGGLGETTLLTSPALSPAELLGDDLFVRHVPIGWPEAAPEAVAIEADSAAERLEVVATIRHWVPVLRVGRASVVGLAVSDGCTFPEAVALSWPGAAVSEAAGGATDIFGNLPGGGEDDEEAPTATTLTAEWLEYEIHVPGETPRVVRRQLFDRIGAGVRLAGGAGATAG